MIPRMKHVTAEDNFILHVIFDDGKDIRYDMKEDMARLSEYDSLKNGLFPCFTIDESRTCISWSKDIDLPSDIIYEYGK